MRVRGSTVFKIYDFGDVTRYRALSFEAKEPETIAWISSFAENDSLLDVGANIGIYSLFAAYRNIAVVAIEPDALNYALLNLNVRLNCFGKSVISYMLAAHDAAKFSVLNASSTQWGGALSSFDNCLDYKGEPYTPVHSQGVYGIPLDDFLTQIKFSPTHIKLDVDGNENLILRGAFSTLRSDSLKSILVELDESRADYRESIHLIESAGFALKSCGEAPLLNGMSLAVYNHIFYRY